MGLAKSTFSDRLTLTTGQNDEMRARQGTAKAKSTQTITSQERKTNNETEGKELLKVLAKAAWPFIAGAVGGLVADCTVGGIAPNFFA